MPASRHIVSEHFGERILVDCKTLEGVGYLVVAVDHFTTYVWATFVRRKTASPIADFVEAVWKDVTEIRAKSPKRSKVATTVDSVWSWGSGVGQVRVLGRRR